MTNDKHRQSKGLTIPKIIKCQLSDELIELLEQDGHGISFNCRKYRGIQMRYMLDNEDYGGSIVVADYDGIENALWFAKAWNMMLRQTHPKKLYQPDPTKGVAFNINYKKDSNSVQYTYQVHYKKDGKTKFKAFYCGTDNTMDTARRKHAERTAWHFRRLYCETLDPDVMSKENSKNWQIKKYYE